MNTTDRTLIEQKIALGWAPERIAAHYSTPLRTVLAVRRFLDQIVDADAFEQVDPTAPKTHCSRGHRMTAANTYQRPGARGGQRECRTCRNDRGRAADARRVAAEIEASIRRHPAGKGRAANLEAAS